MASGARLVTLFLIALVVLGGATSSTPWLAASQTLETEITSITSPNPESSTAPAVVATATPVVAAEILEASSFVKARDGDHLAFYAEPDSYALHNVDDFASSTESLLEEMGDRLEEKLDRKVSFYLHAAKQGQFSALSYAGSSSVYQQFDAKSGRARSRAVTAHELAHHITFQTLGYPESLIHLEGIAHWASEPYWIRAEGRSFDERVRRYLAASKTLPLADLLGDRSRWEGDTQRVAYDEAGSFVGYLIRTYGLSSFKDIYLSSSYEEEYGKSLAELEGDWLAFLKGH